MKELVKKLKQLKNLEVAGQPQASWVSANREILMSQIQPQSIARPVKETVGDGVYYWRHFGNLFRHQILKPVAVSFAVVVMVLSYSATLTVANASLPGDMLYPVKTTTEALQLAFTFNEGEQVQLQMDFVSRRADELQQVVRKPQDNEVKKEIVAKTAQKISQDVQVVKDKLNKISIASLDSGVMAAAKKVDEKTLEVKANIDEAKSNLPEAVKQEVAKDINAALKSTEEAGTSALNVIVKNYQEGTSQVGENEVVTRVAERIKSLEKNIADVKVEVDKITTSTPALMSNSTATSTLQNIAQKPGEATKAVEEAKDLLDQKNFNSALQKIEESKTIVGTVTDQVQSIVDGTVKPTDPASPSGATSGNVLGTSTVSQTGGTSTNLLTGGRTAIISTSTQQTSETTKPIIK